MAELTFKDLIFEEKNGKIRVVFLRLFYFDLDKSTLKKISEFSIDKNTIIFKNISEKKARNKFNFQLSEGFKNLKNRLNNKKTIYIHQNSAIPLIGNVAFGLVDRGTSLIEIKPITSCNLSCIYCSVDQGKRLVDFVVEKDYLVKEFKKLVEFKGIDGIEAHIGTQGEPLLYADLVDLISDLAEIKQVKTISIDTNGTLLTKNTVDKLIKAGLTRFNLSINALDQELAEKIANRPYNIEKVKEIAEYIEKKSELIITPVLIPGINEQEMPKIIEFSGKLKADIGIQNFLNYRYGKNPVKQLNFNVFYEKLRKLEKKYNVKLIKTMKDFDIKKTKELPKPFRKGDIIKAGIAASGRFKGEKIAVSKQRNISIPNCYKEGTVKIHITRTKHNIFIGNLV